MRRRFEYLIYALCGVCMALPYTFTALWTLAWIAFVPVLCLEFSRVGFGKHPLRKAYARGMAFFYPYGIMTFYWFTELYPLEFTGMSKPSALCVVLLGCLGLSLLQALVWAFMFVVLDLANRKLKIFENITVKILFPSLLWVVFEWIQAQTWAGVPWGKIALGQTDVPAIIQSGSLFGPYFVSFVVIIFSALIATTVLSLVSKEGGAGRFSITPKSVITFALAVLLFALNFTYGAVRINILKNKSYENTVSVAAIQGNISSVDKWSSDSLGKTYDIYREQTFLAASEGAELVVWPETAFPYSLTTNPALTEYVTSVAIEADVTILVGAFYRNDNGDLENSIFQVTPDGKISDTHYSKRHLVPFGEYVPMRKIIMTLIPPLNEIGMLDDDILAGTDPAVHDTEVGDVGSLICFDSIYEPLARDSANAGAQLITLSTNDSWFNDSSAVYQHNRHSVLRAIETGRYVVRAANTGISSIISPTGEVIEELPPLVTGQITGEVSMIDTPTLYSTIGNIIVPASLIAMIIMCVFCHYKSRKSTDGNQN